MTMPTTTTARIDCALVDVRSGEYDDGTAYAALEIGDRAGVAMNLHATDPDVLDRLAAAATQAAAEIRDLQDAHQVGAA